MPMLDGLTMGARLQILVPHWQERAADMEPLLDSIALQQAIDFAEVGVVVAHDGAVARRLPEKRWERKYPFAIEHVNAEKGGVSHARNAALDAATAEYVMFCDADDMFFNACGLRIILDEIGSGFDALSSKFMEEARDHETGEPVFVSHEEDSTFVHGKVYRRAYLVDNGIRFDDSLTIHEDSYFNILALSLAKEMRYCETPFYLWRWRDGSACRSGKDYILRTWCNLIDSNDALVDEFERRGEHLKALFYVGMMVFDTYYALNRREWLDDANAGYRDAVERKMGAYMANHGPQWAEIPSYDRMVISNGIRMRTVSEGMPMESFTLGAWLEHVGGLA